MGERESMVELVARAIALAQITRQYVGQIKGVTAGYEIDKIWPEFVPEARAAIMAMREPTPRMLVAGAQHLCFHDHEQTVEDARLCFGAQIDAALSEQPDPSPHSSVRQDPPTTDRSRDER